MNEYEAKMLHILQRGRDEFGVIATKAEFETEGVRTDELLRLVEITYKANLHLALKIGGCGAVRDLAEAKQFGAHYIIAPMIETPYALSKYIAAKQRIFPEPDQSGTQFLFNIETATGYDRCQAIIQLAASQGEMQGVVFGRNDYGRSLTPPIDQLEGEVITQTACSVAALCQDYHLDFVVGGAISPASLPSLLQIQKISLTRFETRKVVFSADALCLPNIQTGLEDAAQFEQLWLSNKQQYYGMLCREDQTRLRVLAERWQNQN